MNRPIVKIEISNLGTIVLELYPDVANSTANFISLATSGFYDGLTFHRVIPQFVAQAGCPLGTGTGGPGYTIDGEFKNNGFANPYTHELGSIAWARSQARNSAGSQFYITLADTAFLDDDYAVFGKTIEGLDILEKLNDLGTNGGTPKEKIVIEKVSVDLNGCQLAPLIKV